MAIPTDSWSASQPSAERLHRSAGDEQVFAVSQNHGTWGSAQEIPGTAALNQGGYAAVNSLSCASPCGCSAGGFYVDGSGNIQAFVVSQK